MIQVAHQDAQGHHFPAPGTADVSIYGARLACTPGVRVLTGPVIGEVTTNSVVSAHFTINTHLWLQSQGLGSSHAAGRTLLPSSYHYCPCPAPDSNKMPLRPTRVVDNYVGTRILILLSTSAPQC